MRSLYVDLALRAMARTRHPSYSLAGDQLLQTLVLAEWVAYWESV